MITMVVPLPTVLNIVSIAAFTMSPLVSSLSSSPPSARADQKIFPECKHRVPASHIHYEFDANIEPVVSVNPGSLVHVETQDCFGSQITPELEHPNRVVSEIPRSQLNPVSSSILFSYCCMFNFRLLGLETQLTLVFPI